MDTAQILLIIVIVSLSIIFILLGVQVFFILRQLQKTAQKVNKILDSASSISESISRPLANFSTLTSGLKMGAFIASLLRGKKKKKEEE